MAPGSTPTFSSCCVRAVAWRSSSQDGTFVNYTYVQRGHPRENHKEKISW